MRPVWISICATLITGFCLLAQEPAAMDAKPPVPPPPMPEVPSLKSSPIDFFRKLLSMPEAERETALTNRTAPQKAALIQKLHEYDTLAPEVRELRLRQTELRWYVQKLINMPAADRKTKLAEVPDRNRELVEERLRQWDEIPADIQKQFLENQNTIAAYFERKNSPVPTPLPAPTARQVKLDEEMKRWEALPPDQRQQMGALFSRFFELNERQKQKMLHSLPEAERKQVEHTVSLYTNLPADQRNQRITSISRLVSMDSNERETFLKNAALWHNMTPQERELWRQLVRKLPPLPPVPPGLESAIRRMPPAPPIPQ